MVLPQVTETAIRELLASISLPAPFSIKPLDSSTGAYHSICIIEYNSATASSPSHLDAAADNGVKKLVLRISAGELPHTKTMNEIAMIKWVRHNTTIPAPDVIAFDHTADNALGYEYSITEYVTGKPLSEVFRQVEEPYALINQLIDYLTQLYDKPFHHIGGLQMDGSQFSPGPMTEWHFWTIKDTQHWPQPLSMNAVGPFDSYLDYCIANIEASKRAIDMHDSMKALRSIPLDQLIEALAHKSSSVNAPRFVLTHRDLHFGNIMYDDENQKITGIIDWELAAILPYQLWNPGNFLWTGGEGKQADEEKARYNDIFTRLCKERELDYLIDTSFISQDQKLMQEAMTLLRSLVNAHVRGWQSSRASHLEEELRAIIEAVVSKRET